MAAMIDLLVGVDGSPHVVWYAIRDKVRAGSFDVKEVKVALCALIVRATSRPNAPKPVLPDDIDGLWDELQVLMVSGWIGHGEVRYTLSHLNELGRFLPFPKRVRDRWDRPSALSDATKESA